MSIDYSRILGNPNPWKFLFQISAVAAATHLPPDDRQLAAFYAAQTATYSAHLATAVEAFLRTVEMGQPPDVFLAHGKFVVLSAHRIVHVGDTVHRCVRDRLSLYY